MRVMLVKANQIACSEEAGRRTEKIAKIVTERIYR